MWLYPTNIFYVFLSGSYFLKTFIQNIKKTQNFEVKSVRFQKQGFEFIQGIS